MGNLRGPRRGRLARSCLNNATSGGCYIRELTDLCGPFRFELSFAQLKLLTGKSDLVRIHVKQELSHALVHIPNSELRRNRRLDAGPAPSLLGHHEGQNTL